ncbi:STAS domain-containing protein [Mycobacterium sp. AMU20-3851]|uniref:STAS domain-containing protein n=1 Tax=Mycobacterium sp. AMU20-3851 TaxID=3122055 RepID=UPI0037547F1B
MLHRPRNRARFDTQTRPPSTVVVTVQGELDAANTDEFSAYIDLRLRNADNLVLDLTGVEFFAAEAFSAIHKVGVQAAAESVQWSMLTSAAADRILQICDPDQALREAG